MMASNRDQSGLSMFRSSGHALIILLSLTAASMLGCGIQFTKADPDTQPLAELRILGTPVAGQKLRLELDYEQNYPLAVDVECRVKQNGKVIQTIGAGAVPGNLDGSPEATPVEGSLVFLFWLDQPGDYEIQCLTTADSDNKLTKDITIRG